MRLAASAFIVFLLVLGVCQYGCVEQRPGVTKESGAFTRLMPATPQRVGAAAEQVLKGMDLMVTQSGPDNDGWRVVARNFQDTRVTVIATPDGDASKVGVNVHPGESEGLSLRVLDKIQQQLR